MTARRIVVVLATIALVSACGGPVLANPAAQRPVATLAPKPSLAAARDPIPIVFPADDAPHRRLTEWWYYTGHLRDESGGRWGFEFVVFRVERGGLPVSWASHLALTDETGGHFTYAQRSDIGGTVDQAPGSGGFSFAIGPGALAGTPWRMSRSDGADVLRAIAGPPETGESGKSAGPAGVDLILRSRAAPLLHDGDGWIDFGPAGGSYYYSRPRLSAEGTVLIGARRLKVEGTAWFDHQWGDFIAVGAGGWDWFAINLDDGTDIMLYLIRDPDGRYPLVSGTLVEPGGRARHLDVDGFKVVVTAHWQSPVTGVDYPAGWRVSLPGEGLMVGLRPTVPGQELDTRPTTGVVYWEGSQVVTASRDGRALGGEAYVELTGYGRAAQAP